MPDPNPLAALFLSLDATPGDHVTLLALADWFEEQGQPEKAACLRWTIRNNLRPFRYTRDGSVTKKSNDWNDGWYWWARADPYIGQGWGHPLHCRLPYQVWEKLHHTFTYDPLVVKQYPTQRDAYEALLDAWPRVGPLGADALSRETNS
jgi:uncharacterized protein (TIGR02996 family)